MHIFHHPPKVSHHKIWPKELEAIPNQMHMWCICQHLSITHKHTHPRTDRQTDTDVGTKMDTICKKYIQFAKLPHTHTHTKKQTATFWRICLAFGCNKHWRSSKKQFGFGLFPFFVVFNFTNQTENKQTNSRSNQQTHIASSSVNVPQCTEQSANTSQITKQLLVLGISFSSQCPTTTILRLSVCCRPRHSRFNATGISICRHTCVHMWPYRLIHGSRSSPYKW